MTQTSPQRIIAKLDSIASKVDAIRAELHAWIEAAEARAAAQVAARRATEELRAEEKRALPAPTPLADVPRYYHPRRPTSHERAIEKKHDAVCKAQSKEMLEAARAKTERIEANRAAYVRQVEQADRDSRKNLACVNPRSGVGRAKHSDPDRDGRCFHCDAVIAEPLPVGARARRQQEARA